MFKYLGTDLSYLTTGIYSLLALAFTQSYTVTSQNARMAWVGRVL